MSKRPKVSLSSIVAETARKAGESSAEPHQTPPSLDEGAPSLVSAPRLVVPAEEPEAHSVPVLPSAAPGSPSVEAASVSGAAIVGLPAILDLKAAAKLRDEFCAAKGGPLEVDASKVQRLGGLCLQVLLSAQRTWAVDGKPFRVVDPSPDFLDGVKAFGAVTLAESAPQAV